MTIKTDRSCRAVNGDRLLNREHLRECNLSGCEGCKPCRPEHGHCTRCHHVHLDEHHSRVCPSCVGKVREDILAILDKADEAHQQLVHRSINSVAFMIAGPAANYEAHSYIHQAATSGSLCKCRRRGTVCPADLPAFVGPACDTCSHHSCRLVRRPRICPDAAFILEETRIDERHPATVLADWELTWRRHLGHDPAEEPTLASSAAYLLANRTYMAQQAPPAPDFDQFAHEIATSRAWLDDVLRLGHRPDRGGTCPVCGKADLVKDWDDADEGTKYDDTRDSKEYADLWVCPNTECAQTWTEQEYQERVQGIYVGVADRLTASQLQARFRVPASTIRRWASGIQPTVRTRGRDASGRQLYDVADVETQRAKTHSDEAS